MWGHQIFIWLQNYMTKNFVKAIFYFFGIVVFIIGLMRKDLIIAVVCLPIVDGGVSCWILGGGVGPPRLRCRKDPEKGPIFPWNTQRGAKRGANFRWNALLRARRHLSRGWSKARMLKWRMSWLRIIGSAVRCMLPCILVHRYELLCRCHTISLHFNTPLWVTEWVIESVSHWMS